MNTEKASFIKRGLSCICHLCIKCADTKKKVKIQKCYKFIFTQNISDAPEVEHFIAYYSKFPSERRRKQNWGIEFKLLSHREGKH